MKNITKLAIKQHINAHKEFVDFCNRNLPRKDKYPLLFEVLQSTANNYFEQLFKVNHNYYPMIEACKSARDRQNKYGIFYKQLKVIDSLIIYIAKLIFLVLIKINFIKIKFERCSLIPSKKIYPDNYFSSDINVSFNFFGKKYLHIIKNSNIIHQLIRKMLITTISPLSIVFLFILIIPLKFNYDNIKKLKNLNKLILFFIEGLLKSDLLFSKLFVKNFGIKEFHTSGWYSAHGSILFNVLSKLNIKSYVIAHGHLSSSTLAYYYPIISDALIVLSEEEKTRLTSVDSYLFNQNKTISYLYKDSDIKTNNIELLKIKMPKIKNIILGFSGAYLFSSDRHYLIYKDLISQLLIKRYNTFFRPHLQDNYYQKNLLSLDGKIDSFTKPLEDIDKDNSMVIGANTTLLLETNTMGILTLQLSDFSTCLPSTIKTILTLTKEEFLIIC